jgi:hypothetical protein
MRDVAQGVVDHGPELGQPGQDESTQ